MVLLFSIEGIILEIKKTLLGKPTDVYQMCKQLKKKHADLYHFKHVVGMCTTPAY